MNSKMTTNSYQQLNLRKQKQTKQTTRTGRDSQKQNTWRVVNREGEGEEGE